MFLRDNPFFQSSIIKRLSYFFKMKVGNIYLHPNQKKIYHRIIFFKYFTGNKTISVSFYELHCSSRTADVFLFKNLYHWKHIANIFNLNKCEGLTGSKVLL